MSRNKWRIANRLRADGLLAYSEGLSKSIRMETAPDGTTENFGIGSRDELLEAASSSSQNVIEPLQYTVYLYFIARYLVAIFEARHGELPLQVWNEYRNAFDHFCRYLTDVEPDKLFSEKVGHLAKMESHTQRAVLDICKIICHRSEERIREETMHWGLEAIRLVEGGSFYSKLKVESEEASRIFQKAKVDDSRLGDDVQKNKAVIDDYLDACFKFDNIIHHLILKSPQIAESLETLRGLQKKYSHISKMNTFWISLAAGVTCLVIGLVMGQIV